MKTNVLLAACCHALLVAVTGGFAVASPAVASPVDSAAASKTVYHIAGVGGSITYGDSGSKHGSQTNAGNWQYKTHFADDYRALLAKSKRATPLIKLYVGLPIPEFLPNGDGVDGIGINGSIIKDEIVPFVRHVAQQAGSGPPALVAIARADSATAKAVSANVTGATTTVSPAPVIVTPLAKENFRIYLLMGQSNMVGRDTRTRDAQTDNPRILALNGKGQWVVAREPIHYGGTGIGPGIPFAAEMLKADPNITIGLIPCAVGGTPLRRWVKGGDLYERAVSRAKAAAPFGRLGGALWHQGESDSDKKENAESYGARLGQMIRDLRQDLDSPNLPVVVGQLGEFLQSEKKPYADIVRAAIREVDATTPNVGYADSATLGHKGDRLHFSAEAEATFGARFAQAMQQLKP
jgi:hypothetical protein